MLIFNSDSSADREQANCSFVAAELTKAAPGQQGAARTSDASASGSSTAGTCDYELKLHMSPAGAHWCGHLVFDIEGDRDPLRTGQTIRCATGAGSLPLHATVTGAVNIGQPKWLHVAVLQNGNGSCSDSMLAAVTVTAAGSGIECHCEVHMCGSRPFLPASVC